MTRSTSSFTDSLHEETLRVDPDGLHLPVAYADTEDDFVVRVPTTTIQIEGGGPMVTRSGVFPLVTPQHWRPDTSADIKNPEATIGTGYVGLKKYGGDLEWWPVSLRAETHDEVTADG